MRSIQTLLLLIAIAAGALGGSGCAVVTTERVATFVVKEVAKDAAKNTWDKLQADKKQRERQQNQQAKSGTTRTTN
ncbi:MAG: hypothetical protein U1A27_02805 [Phycisphaerae bacterium]